MKASEVKLVFAKEMAETLRDRRTLLIMLALPLLICPLLNLAPALLFNTVLKQHDSRTTRVQVVGDASSVRPYMEQSKRIKIVDCGTEDPTKNIIQRRCDVVLTFQPDFSSLIKAGKTGELVLLDSAFSAYITDEENVVEALNRFVSSQREERLKPYDLPRSETNPVEFRTETVESSKQRSAYITGVVCTLLMMLTIISSSMYPALDTITGERERGTLVLLLLSSCDRKSIVVAKLLTVTAIVLVSTILSMASTCISISVFAPTTRDLSGSFALSLPVVNLLLSFVFLLPMTVTVSACSVLLSSYARTFQQGQSYFAPLMIAGLVLSGIALMCDDSPPFFINFVPMANLLLCMHKAIQGQWNLLSIIATMVSSLAYICLLLQLSVGILDNEESLFGIKQGPKQKISYAKDAFVLYGIALVAFFYVMPVLQSLIPIWGILIAQIFVCATPALIAPRVLRLPVATTMSFRQPPLWAFPAVIALFPAFGALTTLIAHWQTAIMPDSESYIKVLQDFVIPTGRYAWAGYITIAVGPAVCEELLFRGALQGLLRKSLRRPVLCLVIGVLFGIIHGSSFRFIPTTAMGIVLAFITEYTGSIFPAMLLHACNNAFAVYEHGQETDLSSAIIPLVIVSTIAGACMLRLGRAMKSPKPAPSAHSEIID